MNGYSLHSVTFKSTTYRDESVFKHPSDVSIYKFKRWEISSIFRDDTFEEGVTHPEDEFIDSGETASFTEWCKKSEDFNPIRFLLELINNFEVAASNDNYFGAEFKGMIDFVREYGNSMNDTVVNDDAIDAVIFLGKQYHLPTINILPFKKARDRYWDQTYAFYSTCKLLTALFDPMHYGPILADMDDFKTQKYKVIID